MEAPATAAAPTRHRPRPPRRARHARQRVQERRLRHRRAHRQRYPGRRHPRRAPLRRAHRVRQPAVSAAASRRSPCSTTAPAWTPPPSASRSSSATAPTSTPEQQDGIGEFGMGLPSSSISQCRRVDVWSWQDGPENALYTYLDLDEITEPHHGRGPRARPAVPPRDWRDVATSAERHARRLVPPRPPRVELGPVPVQELRVPHRAHVPPLPRGRPRVRFASAFDVDHPAAPGGELRAAQRPRST